MVIRGGLTRPPARLPLEEPHRGGDLSLVEAPIDNGLYSDVSQRGTVLEATSHEATIACAAGSFADPPKLRREIAEARRSILDDYDR